MICGKRGVPQLKLPHFSSLNTSLPYTKPGVCYLAFASNTFLSDILLKWKEGRLVLVEGIRYLMVEGQRPMESI